MLMPIRDELGLHTSSPTAGGEPTWVIHDPVRNKFFQIEWRVFEVLRRWKYGTAALIAQAVNRETTLNITENFVEQVCNFLSSNQLFRAGDVQATQTLVDLNKKTKQAWWSWLLHHYLFFRIPIVQPDRFLTSLLPYVRILYSKKTAWLIFACLITGLFLLVRQWDVFMGQLIDLISLKGLVFFGIALLISKIAHELGHAFTAKLYGCRVPTIGVAFLVLWPMLYTDTNESWKLGSRRQRLNIAASGMIVEFSIAAIATLAWSLLPPGSLRDMTFVMATTTWISSLAINFSPFLRFDGYYLLSDWWGMPNLHERSFLIAKWWLRERLFGLDEQQPETFPRGQRFFLILFAFSVWLYRLFLFLGIALLVYHFFFKVVGVILFIVEIAWFIIRPLWAELSEWWVRRISILKEKRFWINLSLLCLVSLALCIPWRNSITTSAVLEAESYNVVYLDIAGRLDALPVTPGKTVKEGQILAQFTNPEINYRTQQVKNQVTAQKEFQKTASLDPEFRQQSSIIAANLVRLRTEQAALEKESERLTLRAPIDGEITDVSLDLSIGQWFGTGQRIVAIKKTSGIKVTGYVEEEDIFRVHKTGSCRFFSPGASFNSLPCNVSVVGKSAEISLEMPMLATSRGGNISASIVGTTLVPDQAIYKITAIINELDLPINRQTMGMLKLDADRKSLVERFWRWAVAVLIRESGT